MSYHTFILHPCFYLLPPSVLLFFFALTISAHGLELLFAGGFFRLRRCGRVAEGGGLLNRYGSKAHHRFESCHLRQLSFHRTGCLHSSEQAARFLLVMDCSRSVPPAVAGGLWFKSERVSTNTITRPLPQAVLTYRLKRLQSFRAFGVIFLPEDCRLRPNSV